MIILNYCILKFKACSPKGDTNMESLILLLQIRNRSKCVQLQVNT